ncbi:MAG: electron transfer flavoprotein subunit beta/FixA family protein [Chlorobiaceae bacterium]|nr:electron transfer flavoprotein subunit beta/FixA family protein [Chlorobiaceae bacterium]NTW74252.1 electron transfer flavoprotein subunit beta/FixA family protein [Chlorobiaceae bacterium]
MNILVCIKQVPDMEASFVPNRGGTWFDETALSFRMNDYDEFAIEAAVRIKEQLGGTPEVTALSIGPGRVVEVIRKAMAMGCDRGVHLRDEEAASLDPWQIASMISGYASTGGFDLIFTGMQSVDRGSAQVGVLVAERLAIACVTTAVGFSYMAGRATVERELEGGAKVVVSCALPLLVTCQLGLNTPRYPTLPGILRAKKKEIVELSPGQAGMEKPLTRVSGFSHHVSRPSGVVLEGRLDELAGRVAAVLREKRDAIRRGGVR